VTKLWERMAIGLLAVVAALITYLWAGAMTRLDELGVAQSVSRVDIMVHEQRIDTVGQKIDKLDGKMDRLIDMHIQGK
jgi:hypothetical protein